MKIIKNEKTIKRNSRIGQVASLSGLLVLGVGMYISFAKPEMIATAWAALLIGFMVSQVGLYFGNRWGRSPRPDELLDIALKGLDDRYAIYHYKTPASHLLVGPSGLWLLFPKHQRGKITYEKNRWKQRGGGFVQGYLRLFGQEGLGRPDLEIAAEIDNLKRFILKNQPDLEIPEFQAALVFTNDNAEIDIEDAPYPSIPAKKLKDMVRKTQKEKGLPPIKLQQIMESLPE
jgi:hypothetical protein